MRHRTTEVKVQPMASRYWRHVAHDRMILTILALGVACVLLAGMFISHTSLTGTLLITTMCGIPVMIFVRGAPLWFFFGLFSLLWQLDVGTFNALNLLAVVCLVSWAIGALAQRQPSLLPFSAMDLAILAFFGVSLLSIATRTSDRPGWYLQVYLLNLGLYFLARSMTSTLAGLRGGLWAFVIGTAATAGLGVWHYANGSVIRSQGLDRLGQEGVGINNLAAVLLAGTAVALGLALVEPQKRRGVLLWAAVALLTFAVVLSKSRGAFVGQAALLVAGILFVRRGRQRLILAVPAIALLVLLLPGQAERVGLADYANRMRGLVTGGSANESPRTYLWQMALEAFSNQPFTGLGVGNFVRPDIWFSLATHEHAPPWVVGPSDVHSFFLGTLADVGLLGTIPLLVALILCATSLRSVLRGVRATPFAGTAYAVAFGLTAYFTAIAMLPTQTLALPYMLVGLVEGLRRATASQPGLARSGVLTPLKNKWRTAPAETSTATVLQSLTGMQRTRGGP